MASFLYKAARRDGALVEGTLEASTEDQALRDLRSKGLIPVKLWPAHLGSASARSAKALFSRSQVLSFTAELAVLLRAGMPIDRSLKVMIDMSAEPGSRLLLQELLDTVKGGKGLSVALEGHRKYFDDFYVSMVRSGEASGDLAGVLTRLAAQLKRAKEVRSEVVSAMIYPAILAMVAIISVFMMLGFVVPQFKALFEDMGEALPYLTQIVITGGEFIKSNGLWLIVASAIMTYGFRRWSRSSKGRQWLDQRFLSAPVLGSVVFKYEVARFSRTMGTLLESGVSVLNAINIAVETVSNVEVRASLATLAPAVKHGGRVSQALADSGDFSPMMVQMVRVGEESGQLSGMLLELAEVYDEEVSAGVKRSLTLLEPILILGMGGMIGLIIVAILMGILSVNDLAV